MNTTALKFGVTRFKNGQFLVQSVAPRGGSSSDLKSKTLGVFDCPVVANKVYSESIPDGYRK